MVGSKLVVDILKAIAEGVGGGRRIITEADRSVTTILLPEEY